MKTLKVPQAKQEIGQRQMGTWMNLAMLDVLQQHNLCSSQETGLLHRLPVQKVPVLEVMQTLKKS
jgi:hypothetical protein